MNPGTTKNPTTPTGPAVLDAEEAAAEENTARDTAYSLDKGAAEAEGELAAADDEKGSSPDPDQDAGPAAARRRAAALAHRLRLCPARKPS